MDRHNVETVGVRRTAGPLWTAIRSRTRWNSSVRTAARGQEECPARACAISFHGWFFAGFARRSDAVPCLQAILARGSDRDVARSG